MESICPICKKPYDGVVCSQCTVTDLDVSGLMASEGLQVESDNSDDAATAFLVDLVSNRKIPITTPRCKVGRDDLNDIVISGDQSISRFHFVITKENNQYFVQDGKSRHGTFLNGNQITAPEPIHDGDVLKVGVSLFWFVIETASSSAEPDRSAPVDLEVMDQQELEFMVPEPISSTPAGNGKQEAAKASELETSPRVQPIRSKRPDSLDSSKKDKGDSKKTAELASPSREDVDAEAEATSSSSKLSASVDGTSNDSGAVHADADKASAEPPKSDLASADETIPPGKMDEELSNSLIGKINAANNKKEPEQESFLVDDDGTTQSLLLNSISNSLRAESSSSVIGADGEFELGGFTFFEPLTEVPKEESQAEPVRGESEANAEAVGKADGKADTAGKAETDGMPQADAKSIVDGKADASEKSDADKNSEAVGKADQSEAISAQESDSSAAKSRTEPIEAAAEESAAEPISASNVEATAESKDASSEKTEKSEKPENFESSQKSETLAAGTEIDAQPKSEYSLQSFSPSGLSDASSSKAEENHQQSAAEKIEPISSTTSETAKVTNGLPEAASAEASSEKEDKSSTLDKFAEIVGELNAPASKKNNEDVVALSKVLSEFQPTKSEPLETKSEPAAEQKQSISEKQPSSNGAKSVMTIVKEPTGGVPDWCKRYFSDELNNLSNELTDLNEQVRAAQQKIKDVEGRVALTKGLRNTLLTAQGEELVEACGRVLTLLGWRVKVSDDDKHELRLDTEDKNICIARIVWTETQADRTHLGQLSISQTRYWCEQGIEPKGILIISKSNDSGPSTLGSSDFNSELAEYATKKNVCLMTTLQLLAVYKDIALHAGAPDEVRATVLASNGWLSGFALEPGDIAEKDEPTNKLSSLLSA